jgi:hypothetical protein
MVIIFLVYQKLEDMVVLIYLLKQDIMKEQLEYIKHLPLIRFRKYLVILVLKN